jgi:hypothetical protein
MKKLYKIEFIGSLASILALCFFIYFQFINESEAVLEITTTSKEELTRIPTDNNLKVQYTFNGDTVTNLWKVKFEIKNIGGKTIIGKENVGILSEHLPIKFGKDNVVFGVEISEMNFPVELIKMDSLNYGFSFKQWKNNDFLELSAYIGNEDYSNIKGITLDERDIIDGKVIISELNSKEISIEPRLIDKLPLNIKKVAWWLMAIGYVFFLLASSWESVKILKSEDMKSSKSSTVAYVIMMIILMIAFLIPLLWVI